MAKRKSRNATHVAALRCIAWAVFWLAVYQSLSHPGPGGMKLGLILAGLLAIYLRATRNQAPRPKGSKS